MKKVRIDQLLVESGFAETLKTAQSLVMSGKVLADEKRIEKSSEMFFPNVFIRLKDDKTNLKYVSRGGLKLEKALTEFHIHPSEYICLDVGSSTGGFTDCLLQNGAKKVYAVDAGTNQLDWKLRNDERVVVSEKTNARNLSSTDFIEKMDLIVMDVSFISVTKILPAIKDLLNEIGKIIILIKPQFEVKKNDVGKGGIVNDPEKHRQVIEKINSFAREIGLINRGLIDSPILGAEGNKEFLAIYEKQQTGR